MYRIFISHVSAELGEAKARKDWLVQQDPPPANDIFLDADMVRTGPLWIDELKQAMKNCDAVVCATSNSWAGRPECIAEFRTAEYLNNRIFCARLETSPADEKTKAWQRIDLFGNGEPTKIPLDDDGPHAFSADGLQNPSGTGGWLPQSEFEQEHGHERRFLGRSSRAYPAPGCWCRLWGLT